LFPKVNVPEALISVTPERKAPADRQDACPVPRWILRQPRRHPRPGFAAALRRSEVVALDVALPRKERRVGARNGRNRCSTVGKKNEALRKQGPRCQ
jgi:hypothetical protein